MQSKEMKTKNNQNKSEVRKMAELVKDILKMYKNAREDDYVLYGFVLNAYNTSVKDSFWTIAQKVRKKELPSFETVSRARRKVQELHPELKGAIQNSRARLEKTKEFIEFAQDQSV